MKTLLRVNPIACEAHGMCAELLPERVTLDDWGYPIVDGIADPARARGARVPRWPRVPDTRVSCWSIGPRPDDGRLPRVGRGGKQIAELARHRGVRDRAPVRGHPVAASHAGDTHPARPTALTVDDDAAPLAVTDDPAFGWQLQDPDRGEIQTAYEIDVYDAVRTAARTASLDTQEVRSSQQSYVHVPGSPASCSPTARTGGRCARGTRRARPARTRRSPTSTPASATATGTRSGSAGRAPSSGVVEDYLAVPQGVHGRRRARSCGRASYTSAGQQYDLRVNGVPRRARPVVLVSRRAVLRDDRHHDADVTAGAANVFAFVTHCGRRARAGPASVPAFIAQITIDHADGTREVDHHRRDVAHARRTVDPRRRRATTRATSSSTSTSGVDPSAGTSPASTTRAGRRATVLGPHPVAPFTHLVAARTPHRRAAR